MSGANTSEILEWLPLLGAEIEVPKLKRKRKKKNLKCKM